MAIFKLELECDNQAFYGDDGTEPGPEIARILREVADRATFIDGEDEHWCRDFNGNKVGAWTFTA